MIIICGCDNNSAPSTATSSPTGPESFTTERPSDSTATPKPQNPAQEIYMVPEYIKYDDCQKLVIEETLNNLKSLNLLVERLRDN